MDSNFIKASSLSTIDHQIAQTEANISTNISPAQYEIIRQVIYYTADFEYQSLVKFSDGALTKGAAALTALTPIIVDVPEIQVSIVPKLQKTFSNSVYCCTTNSSEVVQRSSKASSGLEKLGEKHPHGIFVLGQDQTAVSTMVDLLRNKVIEPSLAIITPAIFIESNTKQRLIESSTPCIYLKSNKGGANVATAIFNGLIELTWRAYPEKV